MAYMARCRDIRNLLFEYNHSEIDHGKHKDIQTHLDNCPECSTYFSEAGRFLSSITYCENITLVKEKERDRTFLSRGAIGGAEDFWANYDTKLFERLENARRRVFFLYLPKFRVVFTEALAGLLVLFGLLAMVEKGLGYGLKTYIYLLKQVW